MSKQLKIIPLPAFHDNYIWLLDDPDHDQVWVVDPGDAKPVKQWLLDNNKQLAGILITHHHPDHIGGVAELSSLTTNIYGPAISQFAETRHPVSAGYQLSVLGLSFSVLDIPGHTANHIGWYCEDGSDGKPILFCGDTLFSAGCGRLLGGTAKQLHSSLNQLKQLPDETLIYCTHEYTLANLEFAKAVEPDNNAIDQWQESAKNLRKNNQITLPTMLADEKQYNPFLRCDLASISTAVAEKASREMADAEETFAQLRAWKDNF